MSTKHKINFEAFGEFAEVAKLFDQVEWNLFTEITTEHRHFGGVIKRDSQEIMASLYHSDESMSFGLLTENKIFSLSRVVTNEGQVVISCKVKPEPTRKIVIELSPELAKVAFENVINKKN